jgi:hypothetical protein
MVDGDVTGPEPGVPTGRGPTGGGPDGGRRKRRKGSGWTLLLMLVPVAAYIYPPLYQHVDPRLGGIPFAIWYQFAWVLAGVAVTGFAYWWHDMRFQDDGEDR